MNPLPTAWNCTPRVMRAGIGRVDRAGRRPVLPDAARALRHRPGGEGLHENGLLIGVPEAFCAPNTVAV